MPLIAAALTAIVVAGVVYLHPAVPAGPAQPAANVTAAMLLPNPYSADYDFVTPSLGWAMVVRGGSETSRLSVYRTSDAANHWSAQLTASFGPSGLTWMKFTDRAHGVIAVGSPGVLYRTADAGAHWESMQLPPYPPIFITFSDQLHGWLMGTDPMPGHAHHFLSTADGGASWIELALPPSGVSGGNGEVGAILAFRRPAEGWSGAGGDLPTVYSTIDAGASWQPHVLPGFAAAPTGVYFRTSVSLLPDAGVIAFSDYDGQGAAYTSFDGGATWRPLEPPPQEATSDFVYQDSFHWWAMNFSTLWKTWDAGQSWEQVARQTDGWYYRPVVIDANHAWAQLFGSPGSIVAGTGLALTSDGGRHWQHVNTPKPA